MTVDYDLKSTLTYLKKKWYVILVTTIIAAVVSMPLSKASFESTLSSYNRSVNFDVLLEEELERLGYQPSVPQGALDRSDEHIVRVSVFYEVTSDSTDKLDQVLSNIAVFTKDEVFLNAFLNTIPNVKVSAFNDLQVSLISGTNCVRLVLSSIEQAMLDEFVKLYPASLSDFFAQTLSLNIKMTLSRIIIHEGLMQPEIEYVDPVYQSAYSNAQAKLSRNLAILQEPTQRSVGGKYMLTAGIFGAMLGIFIVLFMDYIRRSSKKE